MLSVVGLALTTLPISIGDQSLSLRSLLNCTNDTQLGRPWRCSVASTPTMMMHQLHECTNRMRIIAHWIITTANTRTLIKIGDSILLSSINSVQPWTTMSNQRSYSLRQMSRRSLSILSVLHGTHSTPSIIRLHMLDCWSNISWDGSWAAWKYLVY